ncbi:DUF7146 domain-containing protein [Thiocystis violacea]|uniref:DUF7146 domain-containing protein n=1 Tax=Thiocystis violacea TaxID=13725 RepID=UPI001906D545|nr:toprim domain-containing protein [Thiocystis violacea]MBK1720107.1 hypothetical protein [Thiocystis violacea]
MTLDAILVRTQARGRWSGILHQLVPALDPAQERPGRHAPCPVHGGADGFRLFRDVNDTGGGICNTCGAFPDGFALLMWLTGWRFPSVLEAVASALGLTEAVRVRPPLAVRPVSPGSERSLEACRQALQTTWRETCAPSDPVAWPLWRYMESRGIRDTLAWLDQRVVRCHPHLAYYEEGRCVGHYPAMVARVADPHGQAVTLHRTYLARNGLWKAPVVSPKKLMTPLAPLTGGAIRLASVGAELGVAEGIETALAARRLSGQPVWAAVSATLLEKFEPPTRIRRVTIWADLDRSEAGEKAAAALQERLTQAGIETRIRVPNGPIPMDRKGVDWADVAQSGQHRHRAA